MLSGDAQTIRTIRHVLANCECRHAQTGYQALAELDRLVRERDEARAEIERLHDQLAEALKMDRVEYDAALADREAT